MGTTGLAFYRKNQSLQNLLSERPQSLESLRTSLNNAIQDILNQLRSIEREFNGGRKHEEEVRKITKASRTLMRALEMTYLNSAIQITEIIERTLEPSEVFQFDMEAVSTVKEYHRKLIEFIPGRVSTIVDQLSHILRLLQTYCLSFSPIKKLEKDTNPGLETCVHYELKRRELENAIDIHIKNINTMATAYNTDEGVPSRCFGLQSNELARYCDCNDITYPLIFPETCSNIANACSGLLKWVKEDALYVEYLKTDIVSLDNHVVEAQKHLREAKHDEALAYFARKTCQREIDDLANELHKVRRLENMLLQKIDDIETDTRIVSFDLATKEAEMKKFKLDALASVNMREDEYERHVNKIAAEIAKLRVKIPENKHEVETIKSQQKELFEKREAINNKKKEMAQCEKNIIMSKAVIFEANQKKKQADEAYAVLREIYKKKTSPGTTKKIHNEMPVHPRHDLNVPKRPQVKHTKRFFAPALPVIPLLKTKLTKTDPLDRATRIAARRIGGNWPTFYRTLPFNPPRGEAEKDDDIAQISKDMPRGTHSSLAENSLEKWKRRDGLASVKTLKQSLAELNRKDIVEEIEKKAVRPEPTPSERARANWGKVRKFRVTLGKILELKGKAKEARRRKIQEQLLQEKQKIANDPRQYVDISLL